MSSARETRGVQWHGAGGAAQGTGRLLRAAPGSREPLCQAVFHLQLPSSGGVMLGHSARCCYTGEGTLQVPHACVFLTRSE